MSYSLPQILLFIVAYLSGLFAVAHLADRGIIPRRITHHPATYVLSLGVFAGAMASNGVMELAQTYGYNFLIYYLGVVLVFVLATLLLLPLLRLCRVYQLASLADVLTFRFRSSWVGTAATLAMCITLLPLLALQIQAVAESIHILAGNGANTTGSVGAQHGLAQLFCIIITAFSILFGTRHVSSQDRNTGLVTAIAFESLVKLLALLTLMFAAVYQVFGGFGEMQQWLDLSPDRNAMMTVAMESDSTRTLLLVFFAGAVCMPHIFHMAFAENTDSKDLHTASWGLPLYLMLLSLPVLPVIWAGIKLGHNLPMDYSGLGIGLALRSTSITSAAFFAGLSAASATIIVTTLALANMFLNHVILPLGLVQIDRERGIFDQLKWLRRSLIAVLILASYGFFVALGGQQSLAQLALVAFTGTLQFLPGIFAALYWPRANRKGLLAGLAGGLLVWFIYLLLPLLTGYQPKLPGLLFSTPGQQELWSNATLAALALNTALFLLGSTLTRASDDERIAAEICSMDDLARPTRQILSLHSAAEFSRQLSQALGEATAESEVQRALDELQFSADETRPYALRRLRGRIEANLSGLLGPTVAHSIVEQCIPYQQGVANNTEDIYLIERNLERARGQFTGMAADLDNLRLHYRETLDNLPIGVCSMGADGEMLMWNRTMEQITSVPASRVVGSLMESMDEPWRKILREFIDSNSETLSKREVRQDESSRWISLHKAVYPQGGAPNNSDRVILVEDVTDMERLEDELLHSERLASIGRLAAGVAHEIGNPVTGIACLAQNLEYATNTQEIQETARDILTQTERVSRIVESLVNFSHTGSGSGDLELAPSNLADCVDEAIALLVLDHSARPVQFGNHCDREMLVLADSQRLLQVFINLLGNARDACAEQGEINISARQNEGQVEVSVQDNGCGIPQELLGQVFEPFFTTKEPGLGTGLGLALVFSIMDDMGGSVQIHSPLHTGPHPGTRVKLFLQAGTYGAEFQV